MTHKIPGMILAAGRGERMRPLTDQTPKPLLQVKDKSLLDWHIDGMLRSGFERIVINHAWLGQKIADHVQKRGTPDIFFLSSELEALETAGGIKQAEDLIQAIDYFFVINGDIFCPQFSFEKVFHLADTFRSSQPQVLAYLFLVPNPSHNAQGDFALQGSMVSNQTPGAPSFTFSGIGIYHKDLFKEVGRGEKAKLAPLLRSAIQTSQVMGELLEIPWTDVGTPERLAQLNE